MDLKILKKVSTKKFKKRHYNLKKLGFIIEIKEKQP